MSASEPAAASVSLTLVSDRRRLAGGDLAALAAEAGRSGIDVFQLREKDLPDRELLSLAERVAQATRASSTRLLINSRPDVAELVGADGVQLPEQGLPVARVRERYPRLCIGASCHSLASALRAQADGADFVLLGAIFATRGKESRALGTAVLAEVASALRVPVHAIGGIRPETADAARTAGAGGLAAIGAFLEGPLAAMADRLRGGAPGS